MSHEQATLAGWYKRHPCSVRKLLNSRLSDTVSSKHTERGRLSSNQTSERTIYIYIYKARGNALQSRLETLSLAVLSQQ